MEKNKDYYFSVAIDAEGGKPARLSDLTCGQTINALDLDPTVADQIFGKPVMDELHSAADDPELRQTYRVSKIEAGSITFESTD